MFYKIKQDQTNERIHTFSKGICALWNAISLNLSHEYKRFVKC